MIRKNYLIFNTILPALILSGSYVYAQNDVAEWALQFGGKSTDMGYTITSDAGGNIYLGGTFSDTAGIGGISPHISKGGNDIFITKVTKSGQHIWSRQIGGKAGDGISTIKADTGGYIYIAGFFRDTVYFDTTRLIAASNKNSLFISKMDTSGNIAWAKQFGKPDLLSDLAMTAMDVDTDGNVYFTGYIDGDTVDFDPGPNVYNLYGKNEYFGTYRVPWRTGFIAKLTTDGDFGWARQLDGKGYENTVYGFDIAVDKSRSCYVAGLFDDTTDLDPGPNTHHMYGVGTDVFLLKLDTSGDFQWAVKMGGNTRDQAHAVAVDQQGYVYTTGIFRDTADFDLNNPGTHTIIANGQYDFFVVKTDPSGNTIWAKGFGGTGSDQPWGIDVDQLGNVYTAGQFQNNVNFNPGGSNPHNLSSNGNLDIFILKLDSSGHFGWAKSMGAYGWNVSTKSDVGYDVHADASNNIYLTGYFRDTTNFNQGSSPVMDLTANGIDAFLVKYACIDTSSSVIQLEACNSFDFNGTSYTRSGTYTHHFFSGGGCDSLITLDLSISYLEKPLISVSTYELSTTTGFASYRWLLNGDTIPNATGRVHIVTENGSYRVVVTNENGCADTSDAYTVSNVSVGDYAAIAGSISVSPNPTSNVVNIKAPVAVDITLTGIDGKLIKTVKNATMLSVAELNSGIYMLRISDINGNLLQVEKLVKK